MLGYFAWEHFHFNWISMSIDSTNLSENQLNNLNTHYFYHAKHNLYLQNGFCAAEGEIIF